MAPIAEERIPRHEAWRRQYRADRYARHLSPPELNQRIRDVFLNNIHTGENGIHFGKWEVPPDAVSSPSTKWMEKFTHLLEEIKFRNIGFPGDLFRKEPLPNFASDLAKEAARRLASTGVGPEGVFIKFGKRMYMERLFNEGALRIQPATYFAETSHNEARKDDELTHTVSVVLSREGIVQLVINPQDVPADAPDQRIDITLKSPSDYWLYCVSRAVEPRLFVDYSADSCVIIRDRAKFIKMLSAASRNHFRETAMYRGPVEYVDPLLPAKSKTFVPFLKHFRYTYQNEYRFSWLPLSPISKVAPVDVQIGSLKEFSDLIVL